jgi:hypothetical protein
MDRTRFGHFGVAGIATTHAGLFLLVLSLKLSFGGSDRRRIGGVGQNNKRLVADHMIDAAWRSPVLSLGEITVKH